MRIINTLTIVFYPLSMVFCSGGCGHNSSGDRQNFNGGEEGRVAFYVTESYPVMPGDFVDVIEERKGIQTIVHERVLVVYSRWKIEGIFKKPKYPAKGFVTLDFSKSKQAFKENPEAKYVIRLHDDGDH